PGFDAERAAAYDVHIRRISPGYDTLHDHLTSLFREALPPSAHILVVGAGTGAEIERLGREGPGWQFTAIDPSPDMLAVCADRVEADGMAHRVRYVDGTTADAPADLFDAATSICVAHFVLDPEARVSFFADIAERLRPDAPFVHADLFHPGTDSAFGHLMTAWEYAVRRAGMAEDAASAFFQRVDQNVCLADEATLTRETTAAGFGPRIRFHHSLLWGAWLTHRLAG
ncbi:MAG: class I SAM-dependent methyltransferase, partial [Bacteroidota bacterium]